MRYFFIFLLVLVALIGGAIYFLPYLLPAEALKTRVVEEAKRTTGRDVSIGGDLAISAFPQVALRVEDVSISNAPGAKHEQMATMKEMSVGLNLFPLLLNNEVQVSQFVLIDPVLHVEVDKNGKSNWDFSDVATTPEVPSGEDTAPPQEPTGTEETGTPPGETTNDYSVGSVRLDDIRLVNGTVTYDNKQTGDSYDLSNINTAVSLPSLAEPLKIDGDLVFNNEAVDLALILENPESAFSGNESPFQIDLSSDLIDFALNGAATFGEQTNMTGKVDLDVPSIRRLAAWTGNPMDGTQGFGALKISGDLSSTETVTRFTNANLQFDGMNGSGELSIDMSNATPFVKGRLDVDHLNTNPYASGGQATPPESTKTQSQTTQTSQPSVAQSAPAAASKPATSSGWRSEPIDFSGLRAVNADLKLNADRITFNEIKMGKSALDLSINNGLLIADLTELALYDGKGKTKVTIDGRGTRPTVRTVTSFDAVNAFPLLRDAMRLENLEGIGTLTFNLATSGRSQREMMQTLSGSGELRFVDGAIRGINLADMVRNVQDAFFGIENTGAQKTDFTEMGGTFRIINGVIANDDLSLLGPLVRLSGRGQVNVANRTINYRVIPKVVTSLEGQGGNRDLSGAQVPVQITGSWDNPKFAPDLAALITSGIAGHEAAKEAGEDPVQGILKGIFGIKDSKPQQEEEAAGQDAGSPNSDSGNQQPAEPAQEEPKPIDPLDIFKQIIEQSQQPPSQ